MNSQNISNDSSRRGTFIKLVLVSQIFEEFDYSEGSFA